MEDLAADVIIYLRVCSGLPEKCQEQLALGSTTAYMLQGLMLYMHEELHSCNKAAFGTWVHRSLGKTAQCRQR